MNHNKALLLIGGPADGQRLIVPATARIQNICDNGLPDNEDDAAARMADRAHGATSASIHTYAIQAVQGAGHEVYSVGVMDLSVCIPHALVAGYRKPKAHDSDMNVALQMVTFIGGECDGTILPAQSLQTRIAPYPKGPVYEIITLSCKDGLKIRVAVTDETVDPLPILIAGYRFGVPK